MNCKSQDKAFCDKCSQFDDCSDECECRCLDYYVSDWMKMDKKEQKDLEEIKA